MYSPSDRIDIRSLPWLKPATIIFFGSTPFEISALTIEDTLAEDSSNPTLSSGSVISSPTMSNHPVMVAPLFRVIFLLGAVGSMNLVSEIFSEGIIEAQPSAVSPRPWKNTTT